MFCIPWAWKVNTFVLTSLVLIAGAWGVQAEEPAEIFFHEHYNDALKEAKLTRKPLFLEFRCAP